MRHTLPLLIAIVALSSCAETPAQTAAAQSRAADDQAGLDRALAGLVPEKASGCLSSTLLRSSPSTKAYGRTIVYTVSRTEKYRTDTAGGCEGIARGDILITTTPTGQLCRGDIARTVDPAQRIPTGSCSFGDFVRYVRPK